MLDEGVQIFKQAWEHGVATLDGKHYQVDGAICRPRPLQEPSIPLWIAGGGEKVTLRIAAQYAQYTNFDGTPEGFAHKSEILAEHCREVGTDFDQIVRSANYNVMIGSTEAEVRQRVDDYVRRVSPYLSAERIEKQLSGFVDMPAYGTPEQIVEKLTALRQSGMTYGIFYFPEAAWDLSGVELFEREVIPALR